MQNFCKLRCVILLSRVSSGWRVWKGVIYSRKLHACCNKCGKGRESSASWHTELVTVGTMNACNVHWEHCYRKPTGTVLCFEDFVLVGIMTLDNGGNADNSDTWRAFVELWNKQPLKAQERSWKEVGKKFERSWKEGGSMMKSSRTISATPFW